MMIMMSWITYIVPYHKNYTSRVLYKNSKNDTLNKYAFNSHLNELSMGVSLICLERLFLHLVPPHRKLGHRFLCKVVCE